MINIKGIIDDIFVIISKKQTLFEFLLNLSLSIYWELL